MIAIRKNSREEIRVSLDDFRGQTLFNLRVWYQAEDGTKRSGKQGIAFRREQLADVLAAMQSEGAA